MHFYNGHIVILIDVFIIICVCVCLCVYIRTNISIFKNTCNKASLVEALPLFWILHIKHYYLGSTGPFHTGNHWKPSGSFSDLPAKTGHIQSCLSGIKADSRSALRHSCPPHGPYHVGREAASACGTPWDNNVERTQEWEPFQMSTGENFPGGCWASASRRSWCRVIGSKT